MPYFTRTRRPSCDLEPVEATESPAPELQPGCAPRARTTTRDRLAQLIAAHRNATRLTPSERREQADDRTRQLETLVSEHERAQHAKREADPIALADQVAQTWGLSEHERTVLRPFATAAARSGLDRALDLLGRLLRRGQPAALRHRAGAADSVRTVTGRGIQVAVRLVHAPRPPRAAT